MAASIISALKLIQLIFCRFKTNFYPHELGEGFAVLTLQPIDFLLQLRVDRDENFVLGLLSGELAGAHPEFGIHLLQLASARLHADF